MKNFVIGDIQGCYKGLRATLKKAKFDKHKDKLWAVGDLVARGPDSLSTLQYLSDLGEHFDTVLGNHDLHLIATAHGINKPKPQDKLDSLLKHKHFDQFIDFLMQKPLALMVDDNTLITHAGLHPHWSFKKALKMSSKVSSELQGKNVTSFLKNMYGNEPILWSKDLSKEEKLRFSVNSMTRMRFLHADGGLEFKTKCHPKMAPKELSPWFAFDNAKLKKRHRIIFGHWASLFGQVTLNKNQVHQVIGLDTGYVWGNAMTLYCIESQKRIQQEA